MNMQRANIGAGIRPSEPCGRFDGFEYSLSIPMLDPTQQQTQGGRLWKVIFDNAQVAEAVRRVEDMLNGDPLRRHSTLTAEQFALDSNLMAKQVVTNILTALKGEPRPS